MLPQNDINIFQALTEIPRPSCVIEFPRKLPGDKIVEVSLQLLTTSEAMQCKADAETKTRKWLKDNIANKNEKSIGYEELYRDFLIVNVLWYATRHRDSIKERFFPTKDSIHDVLTPDEIGILYNHYATLQLHKGPVISDLSSEEVDVWINRIIKDGADSAFFLNSFTLEMLKVLLITMASRLPPSQTDNS